MDAGFAKAIGTSNMTISKMATLLKTARIVPAVNQVEMHPFLPQDELKAFCDGHGIVSSAFSPLGSPDRPARLIADGDPAPLHDPTVLAVAAATGKSAAAVLIRWAVQRNTVVLPKSVTPARIAANLDAFSWSLSEDQMAQLAKLATGQRLNKGHPWVLEGGSWQDNWV